MSEAGKPVDEGQVPAPAVPITHCRSPEAGRLGPESEKCGAIGDHVPWKVGGGGRLEQKCPVKVLSSSHVSCRSFPHLL